MTDKELKQKLCLNIAFVFIGLAMMITGWVLTVIREGTFSEISGIGIGFAVIGVLRVLQIRKILKGDKEALRKLNEGYDERNVMIYNKAMSTTMRICLSAAFIAMFVLYVLEETVVANTIAFLVIGSVVIYSVCYWIYSKKY